MNDYTSVLSNTVTRTGATLAVTGLVVNQFLIVGVVLILVGIASLAIRHGWRRGKTITEL